MTSTQVEVQTEPAVKPIIAAKTETDRFFYLTNIGITDAEIDQQWAIGDSLLKLPMEEKLKYRADLENGDYNGYRPLGSIEQFPGKRDNWECYHVFKFNPEYERAHPQIVKDKYDEIEKFHRHVHQNVAYRVLRLLGDVLELPENTLVDKHQYENPCSSFLRYMKYHPRSPEVNASYNNTYTRGHTDFGSITFLFSQDVPGLELQTRDGEWHAVRHVPNSIIVNTADMMHFWTNGYFKSCMHRVVAPPVDQMHKERFGLIYFLRPNDEAQLKTLNSPLLKRLGLFDKKERPDLEEKRNIKVGEWVPIQTKKNWTPFDKQPQGQREFQSLFR
ncbi:2og-fe oxygenase family oxidoreductase [Stemphylium lycopersici]|uniref:2og-fe oxygenase family oxidoreductase n=1 Tax=Stemphylium lycopersici TaxID=183478 RepID=A0A364N5H6_STELY|nr:2og-fe oxygenase family oxidoreductase [Stemphylium lycopersici]